MVSSLNSPSPLFFLVKIAIILWAEMGEIPRTSVVEQGLWGSGMIICPNSDNSADHVVTVSA